MLFGQRDMEHTAGWKIHIVNTGEVLWREGGVLVVFLFGVDIYLIRAPVALLLVG